MYDEWRVYIVAVVVVCRCFFCGDVLRDTQLRKLLIERGFTLDI